MFVVSNYTRLVCKYNVEPTTASNKLILDNPCLVNSHSKKIRIRITISWGGPPPLEALIKLRDPSSPTAEMGTKMKGLIKGLRYISQIFDDSSSEEEEMQIGNPTDVKHVAHIGWDGPSVVHNSPSWMDEFSKSGAPQPELPQENPEAQKLADPQKQAKKSRRHNSAANSMNSPTQDLLEGSKPRRNKNLSDGAVVENSSSAREGSSSVPVPKQPKKKKSKDSSVGGSTRSKDSSVGGSTRSRRKECSTLTCTVSSDDPGSGGP